MNALLRMKHWQIFLLMFGPIPLSFLIGGLNFQLALLVPASYCFCYLVYLAWIFSVFRGLNDKLPEGSEIDIRFFSKMFMLPIAALGFIIFMLLLITLEMTGLAGDIAPSFTMSEYVWLIAWAVSLYGFFIWIQGARVAAKSIKSVELQNGVGLGEYMGELLLIFIFGIGVWILQPTVNRLIAGETKPEKTTTV